MKIENIRLYNNQMSNKYDIVFDYDNYDNLKNLMYNYSPDGSNDYINVNTNTKGLYLDLNKNFNVNIITNITELDKYNYICVKTDNDYIFGFINNYVQVGNNVYTIYCTYDFWTNNILKLNSLNKNEINGHIISKHFNRYGNSNSTFKGFNILTPNISSYKKNIEQDKFYILCVNIISTEAIFDYVIDTNIIYNGLYSYRIPIGILETENNKLNDFIYLDGNSYVIQNIEIIAKLLTGSFSDSIIYSQLTYSIDYNENNNIEEYTNPIGSGTIYRYNNINNYFESHNFTIGQITNNIMIKGDIDSKYELIKSFTFNRQNVIDGEPILNEFPFKYKSLVCFNNEIPIIFKEDDIMVRYDFYYCQGQVLFDITRIKIEIDSNTGLPITIGYKDYSKYVPITKNSLFTISKDYYNILLNSSGNTLALQQTQADTNVKTSLLTGLSSVGVGALAGSKGGWVGALIGGVSGAISSLPNIFNSIYDSLSIDKKLADAQNIPNSASLTSNRDETMYSYTDRIILVDNENNDTFIKEYYENLIKITGYQIDTYDNPLLNTRQIFDYVKCSSIFINNNNFSQIDINKIKQIFIDGTVKYHKNIILENNTYKIDSSKVNLFVENNEV